jgi:hypothetical protein
MPTNRRASAVVCGNGVSTLEQWRRSFRKRASAMALVDQNKQSFLLPFEDNGLPIQNYTNETIKIGPLYEFVDSASSCIGQGAFGDVFLVSLHY